ncbi:hypothetical protein FHS68_001704 [Dyadobacter arcticus]|uniref:Uncharacterized protein n=1 Tax=Dyadobacter arcticus TaxID=1078754 RepID=A0ABX0UHN3_9BACT|nr:hypothetical protein [Dyadobacter arcticus]
MINRSIKKLLDNKLNDDTGLDQQFKEALQEKIIKQLDEK